MRKRSERARGGWWEPEGLLAWVLCAAIVSPAVFSSVLAQSTPAGKVPVPPPPPEQNLKQLEQNLAGEKARVQSLEQRSDTLSLEVLELRSTLVSMADEAGRLEAELTTLEVQLSALEAKEKSRSERLLADRQEAARLLAALQRISRLPPEALLAEPEKLPDAVRASMLLSAVLPALRARSETLATELQALTDTRRQLAQKREHATAARSRLTQRYREMETLVARRIKLSQRTETERQAVSLRMSRLAGQAADLRQLMERVEAERRAEEAARAKAEAERQAVEKAAVERRAAERRAASLAPPGGSGGAGTASGSNSGGGSSGNTETSSSDPARLGNLRLPATGRVAVRYGEADRYGATSRGLTINTRPGATVISPFAGQVQFAGPFRGYGQILIVEHGHGYHSLIAGLGRIDGQVGQTVSAGEPLGIMPGENTPDLYFELRRNGQPVNPQRGIGG